jgi:peptidoglycan/xylan/chitin deacetylase (PgdA/CDA1 family)
MKAIANALLATPMIWRGLQWRATRGGALTILCYHTIGPDQGGAEGWSVLRSSDFREQMSHVLANYEIVEFDGSILADPPEGRPRAVITFDDGDRGLHKYLLPTLREMPFPVTVYVATEQIETGKTLWFDRVINALNAPGEVQITGLGSWHIPAETGAARWDVVRQVLAALKNVDPEKREALSDLVVKQGHGPNKQALGPMTRSQLVELSETPGVTIGSHSHGHELLDQIPLDDARESMARSRALLQDWTGQDVRHFAFPNGNHNAMLRDVVRNLGFETAAILEERLASPRVDPFAVPRISIGRFDNWARFRLRLTGI